MNEITCFFDGSITKNPGGTAKYGFIITTTNKTLWFNGKIGTGKGMTNNVAEIVALEKLLLKLMERNYKKHTVIIIKGDSQLVLKWVSGQYKSNCETARKYVPFIKKLLKHLKDRQKWSISLKHIPSGLNKAHDAIKVRQIANF